MIHEIPSFIIFFLSSFITIALTYFNFPISFIQQIIAVLIIIIVVTLNKSLFAASESQKVKQLKWVLLFIYTLLIQLTVISSGGIFSPFFILLHLSALGISLLISFSSAFVFVVFCLLVLGANIYLDKNIMSLFL